MTAATAEPKATPRTQPRDKPRDQPKADQPTPWNVVLLDDQHHTYEYVIEMMQKIFGHSLEKSVEIAVTVDTQGRAVCLTTHKEHAELKRDQVLSFGPDARIRACKGSMSAIIEPALGGGDDPPPDNGKHGPTKDHKPDKPGA